MLVIRNQVQTTKSCMSMKKFKKKNKEMIIVKVIIVVPVMFEDVIVYMENKR